MFKFIFERPRDIRPHSIDYSRMRFLHAFGVLLTVALLFFIPYNYFITQKHGLALCETITLISIIVALLHFHRKKSVPFTSYIFITLTLFVTLCVALFSTDVNYSLVWNVFTPIAVFYLLGRERGLYVNIGYLLILFSIVLFHPDIGLSAIAKINIIASYTVLTLGIYFYEASREAIYAHQETLLKREQAQIALLQKISSTDKLTQLANRTRLDNILEVEHERADRHNLVYALILLDIDHFKRINDTYGHQAGDTVLVEFATLLQGSLRKIDFVGRWGGEEFLIIAPNTNLENARLLVNKLIKKINDTTFSYTGATTASFGIATYQGKGDTINTILTRADDALYLAKNGGRNQFADESMLKS